MMTILVFVKFFSTIEAEELLTSAPVRLTFNEGASFCSFNHGSTMRTFSNSYIILGNPFHDYFSFSLVFLSRPLILACLSLMRTILTMRAEHEFTGVALV